MATNTYCFKCKIVRPARVFFNKLIIRLITVKNAKNVFKEWIITATSSEIALEKTIISFLFCFFFTQHCHHYTSVFIQHLRFLLLKSKNFYYL